MRSLMRTVLRFPALHRYLRRSYEEEANRRGAPARAIETSVGETLALSCRAASEGGAPRLNLLVPALSIRHVFGGISTALQLFEVLTRGMADVRIILTDEQNFALEDNPAMSGWKIATLEEEDQPGRLIVAAGNRYGRTLAVSSRDYFMATAWWTAHLGRGIRDWQARAFGLPQRRPFVYLVQDFEPGFYPWSSRYALADATYRQDDGIVAVFNTSLLKQFFLDEDYRFDDAFVLEPGLNSGLRKELEDAKPIKRESRVLVYGRPGVERNGFPLIVEALRLWCAEDPRNGWKFISVGEPHPAIPLASGKSLVSLGKLTIAQYGEQMRRASIGISLMVSPHPSYPPLEMAAFGMTVVTNRYKRKNLSEFCSGIISVEPLNAAEIAGALDRIVADEGYGTVGPVGAVGFFRDYLDGGTDLDRLGREVGERLFVLAGGAVRLPETHG